MQMPNSDYSNIMRVYPSSFLGRPDIESGNKIILPSNVLYELSNTTLPQPMIFKIKSMRSNQAWYCGVLEFVAPEEMIVIPFWMFRLMRLIEGEMLTITLSPPLPKASYLKLQPHETAFIELPDPRGFLEVNLRNFVCLQEGQSFELEVPFGDKKSFTFDVKEILPKNPFKAVCLIDCNLNLDFEAPLDYVEPTKPSLEKQQSSLTIEQEDKKFRAFKGSGGRLDGKPMKASDLLKEKEEKESNEWNPRKCILVNGVRRIDDFNAFQGIARKMC